MAELSPGAQPLLLLPHLGSLRIHMHAGHEPGNPAMVSVGNLTLFAYPDGTIDTLALNSPCP